MDIEGTQKVGVGSTDGEVHAIEVVQTTVDSHQGLLGLGAVERRSLLLDLD